jgi:hypothetical protein
MLNRKIVFEGRVRFLQHYQLLGGVFVCKAVAIPVDLELVDLGEKSLHHTVLRLGLDLTLTVRLARGFLQLDQLLLQPRDFEPHQLQLVLYWCPRGRLLLPLIRLATGH